jgi:hypothetical protein
VDAEPGPADPDELDDRIAAGSARYRKLPARVAVKDMQAEQPVGEPPDGRDQGIRARDQS